MNNSKKNIKVTFHTLTPLWTGDAWGESNELKLTGIIGTLRWWFEVLVRGVGYKACDSTGDNNKCQVEIKSPENVLKIHEKICPICYLFGTTGWKSRFSVVLENSNLSKPYNGKVLVKINGGKSWHYESGLMGDVTLNFQYDENMIIGELKEPDREDKKIITMQIFPSILKVLLYFISEYGMIGAKTSIGYGVTKFKVENSDISITEDDWKNFEDYLNLFDKNNVKNLKDKEKEKQEELPNLKDFFFVKFNVLNSIDNIINNVKGFFKYQDGIVETNVIDKGKDKGWCITSPVIRKCLRCVFRGKYSKRVCVNNKSCLRNYWWNYYNENDSRNKTNTKYNANLTIDRINITEREAQNIRHFLMGSTSEPEFSAIQVSHVYNQNNNLEFRIYGWLSDAWPINGKVNDIIKLLENIFTDVPWKEKHKRESGKTIKSDLLPSQIQEGICWNSSNKLLLIKHKSIKDLFNISEGHNYEV